MLECVSEGTGRDKDEDESELLMRFLMSIRLILALDYPGKCYYSCKLVVG